MSDQSPIIRRAGEVDAKPLADFAEHTFRETFLAENDPADIELHCKQSFGADIQRDEILDPNFYTLLAEHDGELVAYAQVRRFSPKEGVHAARPSELCRLYVGSDWQGKGLAAALMAEALAAARRCGADAQWLSVWERNPRAIAFYRKFGFEVVGEHVFKVGNDPQRDLVMAVEIAAGTGG